MQHRLVQNWRTPFLMEGSSVGDLCTGFVGVFLRRFLMILYWYLYDWVVLDSCFLRRSVLYSVYICTWNDTKIHILNTTVVILWIEQFCFWVCSSLRLISFALDNWWGEKKNWIVLTLLLSCLFSLLYYVLHTSRFPSSF